MGTPVFSFDTEQFSRICPFYILVNSRLEITSFGASIAKIHPVNKSDLFTDVFRIKLSNGDCSDFGAFKEQAGRDVILDFIGADGSSLQGQFEYLSEQDQLLFVGSPCNPGNGIKNGKPANGVALNGDAEQQKQLELQLKINEKRYRDLFNYSQAFIFTHDMNGKLLSVNPAICEKLGYTVEELTGRNITEFIPKNDLVNFHSAYLNTVIQKGSAKGIFRVNGKTDKKSFLLYQNFKVEEENTEPYIIGFSQDITERIKIEKELRKTKRKSSSSRI